MELPNKKYQIIYADPPWKTRYFKERKEGRMKRDFGVKVPYDVMSDDEIIELPIKNIVEDDAILFLWAIDKKIPLVSLIMNSWGFKYKTVGFVWVKKAKTTNGTNSTFSVYTRKACEFCFIGTRGKYIVKKKNIDQLIIEAKKKHSQKPDVIRARIVEMVGDLSRIELFARDRREGWDCYGDQLSSTIQKLIT